LRFEKQRIGGGANVLQCQRRLSAERPGATSYDSVAIVRPISESWMTSTVFALVFSKDRVREAIAAAIGRYRLWQTDLQSIVTPLRLDALPLLFVRAIASACQR
jgi:hypothetical protein